MNKQEQTGHVLNVQQQVQVNTKEALSELGYSRSEIEIKTFIPPDYYSMLPEDVMRIYRDAKKSSVLALHQLGFSEREIERRLGGNSRKIIHLMIQDGLEEAKNKAYSD